MGKIICCCNKAKSMCDLQCSKGKRLRPDHIVHIPAWPKIEGVRIVTTMEKK